MAASKRTVAKQAMSMEVTEAEMATAIVAATFYKNNPAALDIAASFVTGEGWTHLLRVGPSSPVVDPDNPDVPLGAREN